MVGHQAMADESNAPFFVLGAARSGTTLLRLMLNRHPRLAIPPESHFLLGLLAEIPAGRELAPREVRRAAELIVGHPRFRTWHVPADALGAELARLGPTSLAGLVDAVYRLETARSGKPRWGDKTPAYSPIWERLAALFPEALFLHLIRDGRDVSSSLARVGWHGSSECERARYWASRVAMAGDCLLRLGPARCRLVRYEDLVRQPESTLDGICRFLGEDFDPVMLRFHADAFDHVSGFDGPVHSQLGRPPREADADRWRAEGSLLRILLFESIAGEAMDRVPNRRRFGGCWRGLAAAVGLLYRGALRIERRLPQRRPRPLAPTAASRG
jgi:hypothetical protein